MSEEEVRIVGAAPHPTAVIRVRTPRAQLGQAIRTNLDNVYASLRGRGVTGLGHNIVLYHSRPSDDVFDVEIGVEVPEGAAADGEVIISRTPGGRAATLAFFGSYDGLIRAHQTLRTWLAENDYQRARFDWEVYGDWSDDPGQLRTDVYYLFEDRAGG